MTTHDLDARWSIVVTPLSIYDGLLKYTNPHTVATIVPVTTKAICDQEAASSSNMGQTTVTTSTTATSPRAVATMRSNTGRARVANRVVTARW